MKLWQIDWIHHFANVDIIIGEKDCWVKGYATEAIQLVANYAFRVLNLHKLTAGCYDLNQGSVKVFQKAGFFIEGIRKQHFYCDGAYVDAILMGILRLKGEEKYEGAGNLWRFSSAAGATATSQLSRSGRTR